MDREEIEDLVHASLGRQLRVTCVLGLLFLVIGFVLGHHVALQHSHQLSDQWSSRVDQLAAHVKQVEAQLKSEMAKVRKVAQESLASQQAGQLAIEEFREAQASQTSLLQQVQQQLNETRKQVLATSETQRSRIAQSIATTQQERARLKQQLQPYLDRKMTIQATQVSAAIDHLADAQVTELQQLSRSPVAKIHESAPLDSTISAVDAEEDSTHCPDPIEGPLVPIPETQDRMALMPWRDAAIARMPIPAEPQGNPELGGEPSRFFQPPRSQRLFLSSKPVEVSRAAEPTVR